MTEKLKSFIYPIGLLSILAIAFVWAQSIMTNIEITYESSEYLGVCEQTRFIRGGWGQNNGYAVMVSGTEYFSTELFTKGDSVYLVQKEGHYRPSIYNWNPMGEK